MVTDFFNFDAQIAQKIAVPTHSTKIIEATNVIVPLILSVARRAMGVKGVSNNNKIARTRISRPPSTAISIGTVQSRGAVDELVSRTGLFASGIAGTCAV